MAQMSGTGPSGCGRGRNRTFREAQRSGHTLNEKVGSNVKIRDEGDRVRVRVVQILIHGSGVGVAERVKSAGAARTR